MRAVFSIVLLAFPWLQKIFYGPNPTLVQSLITWLCLSIFLLVSGFNHKSFTDHKPFIFTALALAALLCACLGLLQYFGFTAWLQSLVTPATIGQAVGNLRQRNHFASLIATGLIALLWLAHLKQKPYKYNDLCLYLGVALLAASNAASGSRTGLFQWLLICILFWCWSLTDKKVLIFALIAYAVSAFALPLLIGSGLQGSGILSRLQETSPTCASRLTLWSNVLHLIAQKPLLGWGWGMLDYAHFVTLYPTHRFCGIVDNAHNLPLHLAVELGVPIATLICGSIVALVFLAKPWKETNISRQAAWAILAVIDLHNLLEYSLWYAPFQLATLLALYILMGSRLQTFAVNHARSFIVLPTFAGLLLLFSSCFVAYDYWRMSQVYLPISSRAKSFQTDTFIKSKASWFFKDWVFFAELTTTPLTKHNATYVYANAEHLLRFSPEPRVIEKLIESATMLGKTQEASFYLLRYKAAFPDEAGQWSSRNLR